MREHTINMDNGDQLFFYSYSNSKGKPSNIILYLQGSGPSPLFTYVEQNGKAYSFKWFKSDYKNLPDNYIYVIIAKPGLNGLIHEDSLSLVPQEYSKSNYLDYRVEQANTVINFLLKQEVFNPQKVVVYGHSEGARVAAKLASKNSKITHLGFWSGSVLPDYYDFITQHKNQKKDSLKMLLMEGELKEFKAISESPNSIENAYNEYSNKYWFSYSEPILYSLINLKIPVFLQGASIDNVTPVENNFLLALEFIRVGKKNFELQTCKGCDHQYLVENGSEVIDKWEDIFSNFFKWVESN